MSEKKKSKKVKAASDEKELKKGKKAKAAEGKVKKTKSEDAPAKKKKAKKEAVPGKWVTPRPDWKAPAEFKAYHFKVTLRTEEDGMIGSRVDAVRYVGKIEEDKDPKKMFAMNTYDQATVRGIAARLAMVTYHATGKPNKEGISPRLEPDTTYELHCRVGANKSGNLKATVNKVFVLKVKAGKKNGRLVELDKKAVVVRKLRKANRFLAAAFTNTVNPPKVERQKRRQDADEE